MKRRGARFSFIGILIFFLTLSATVIATLFIYERAKLRYGDNKGAVTLIVFLLVAFFATVYSICDLFRRKWMIDRPVERILQATERIASGDFCVRLTPTHPYPHHDEFDEIMENLNVLAQTLGKSEILKTDFIANVSHELKTPLAVIQNYASACLGDKTDEATRKAYLQTILSASKKLADLVANILQLNKLENNQTPPKKEWTRLDEQLAECLLAFELQIEKKNLQIQTELAELEIHTAPALLSLVWSNLLSNAVKFTDENGKIRVTLRLINGCACVEIADTGCGIPAQTGERLFEKFYQVDTSHSGEGNGLGLALVKKVIDVLGGEISVQSQLGEGTRFTVLLKEIVKEV